MIINHPLLGPRDADEFTYLGDARLMERPDPEGKDPIETFHDYVYLRENSPELVRELWFHEQGDRSWLVVTRNPSTHEILGVELARNVKAGAKKAGAKKSENAKRGKK